MSNSSKLSSRAGRSMAIVAVLACTACAVLAAPPASDKTRAAEAKARRHIATFTAHSLNDAEHTYETKDVIVDDDGAQHVRFDRRLRGMRVIGGDLVVHSDGYGIFRHTSMTLKRSLNVARRAAVPPERAVAAALQADAVSRRPLVADVRSPELLVYAAGDVPALAYDVRLSGERADGTPSLMHVIVDAQTGLVLSRWDDIHTAAAAGTGKTVYSGTVPLTLDTGVTNGVNTFALRDPTRGNSWTYDPCHRR